MKTARISMKSLAMGGCAFGALIAAAAPAAGAEFAVEAQSLQPALQQFASQGDQQVLFSSAAVAGKSTAGFTGEASPEDALQRLLSGTDLTWSKTADGALLVMTQAEARVRRPQLAQTAEGGGGATVEALIVTAQKREEDIQDVPIAISAFSQEDLTRSQVAGGPDLITQVPNMTFTKTNFSSYSVQIRGIGTQAISATTDPAVAVAFNNTPFIRNRFFEQEFYDLQRVEVLRGPQGTLYGRNATAGVVNIISQKPKFYFEAKASGDVSNYNSSRLEGMVNIPLVEDAVALRVAGAWTKRDGYATNELTGNPIDGRDLWSTRVTLRFAPPDSRLDLNLIWEHFEESDDRLRSGKQLCDKHVVTEFGGITFTDLNKRIKDAGQGGFPVQSSFSTGCERNSLYSPESFQTVMGLSVPYYFPMSYVGLPAARQDPYVSTAQSPNLRVIESTVDPDYRAKTDIGQLQISFDLTDDLTLTSETAYATDWVWSLQDFNRFNTAPGAWQQTSVRKGAIQPGPNGGIFCDPQLGCSDRLVAVDLSTAEYWQFSQEFRLASDYDGSFNFSLGANFLKTDGEDKYYVFINSLSLGAATIIDRPMPPYEAGVTDNRHCLLGDGDGFVEGDPTQLYGYTCVYIDPNPIGSLNDRGHNYFLSKNPYTLHSYAVFGEAYYNISEALKVTGGLRWSVDQKRAPRIPTWAFLSNSWGYPVMEVEEQEWREPTGRLVVDWKPDLTFTDETLVYASYAHGYKAGGSNPPVYAGYGVQRSVTRPKTFDPEFVDAFEVGSKNTLLDGLVTVNLAAFYYDYTGYQISEIVDRSAFNRNFDSEVWGAEIEADWRPLENLRLGFKGGYQKTRIADGERAIDLMDRTAGNDDWIVVRPFPTRASSCIVPKYLYLVTSDGEIQGPGSMSGGGDGLSTCEFAYQEGLDPVTGLEYVPNPTQSANGQLFPGNWPAPGTPGAYPGFNPFDESPGHNFGEGFFKELGGNELPNAPNWTGTITADYTLPLPNEWLVNLHTDLHWQAESWWRVFNDHEFSKLDEYFTMNLAAIFTNEERGWNIMAYIKNVTDETAITGAFLNSDDTGLTTNVFLTEPRLYGLRVTKAWTGGPLLGSLGQRRDGPYPFTVELGGQVQRHDALYATIRPGFADSLDPVLDVFGQEQNQDLDWGDGREVKLTWRPQGDWKVSVGIRVGKTNSDTAKARGQYETDRVCGFGGYFAKYCELVQDDPVKYISQTNWLDSAARSREEHQLVDFAVGRDLGIGAFGESSIDLGIRYAKLQSKTNIHVDADTEWYLPQGWLVPGYYQVPGYISRHVWREADLESSREFEGTGPVLSWAASTPLLGSNETGHLRLDWGAVTGVLFGKQRTSLSGSETEILYEPWGGYAFRGYVEPTSVDETPVNISRSQDATVPVLDLSLGLSYRVGGASIGAGYRWERYFDAIDGGFEEAESYDRTIDGPYFKIAVGFGG